MKTLGILFLFFTLSSPETFADASSSGVCTLKVVGDRVCYRKQDGTERPCRLVFPFQKNTFYKSKTEELVMPDETLSSCKDLAQVKREIKSLTLTDNEKSAYFTVKKVEFKFVADNGSGSFEGTF